MIPAALAFFFARSKWFCVSETTAILREAYVEFFISSDGLITTGRF